MFANWLKASFWFNPNPSSDFQLKKEMLFIFLGLLIFSFIYLTIMGLAFKNSKAYNILKEQVFYFVFSVSLLWLIVWFFRAQGIVYLGAPVSFLIVAVISFAWLVYLIIIIFRTFLPFLRKEKNWLRKLKYLPQPKKREE